MRDILLPLFGLQWLFASTMTDLAPLWERLLEKWGIAFIGIALLAYLARWTAKREELARKERDKREAESAAERITLLQRNNQLQEESMKAQREHSLRLENLTKEVTKAVNDSGSGMRMLMRKMQRPCVAPFVHPDDEGGEG
jgi:hypothetical protein